MTLKGSAARDGFGTVVTSVGDMDGDGISEILVGTPFKNGIARTSGEVSLHRGSDGLELWAWCGDSPKGMGGEAVTPIGDLNGDGVIDFAVSGPFEDHGGLDSGTVHVLSGLDGSEILALHGRAPGDEFGTAVAAVGDMDGDGISEIAVGAPGMDGNGDDAGAVYVISALSGTDILVQYGDAPGDRLGSSILQAGGPGYGMDLNGDGFPDLLVGAEQPAGPGYVRAYADPTGSAFYTTSGTANGDDFGHSLCMVGDLDGDGISEFAVGIPGHDGSVENGGAVAVLSGSNGTVISTLYGEAKHGSFGHSVAAIGDMDGDGISEFAVGAPGVSFPGEPGAGQIEIRSAVTGARLATLEGTTKCRLGTAVASFDDLDGDGISEFLVSAPGQACVALYSARPSSKKPPIDRSEAQSSGWKWRWGNNGSHWIGGWHIGSASRFLSGHFIAGEPGEQLLSLGPVAGPTDYAKLHLFTGNDWPNPWGNNGNGSIGFWGMSSSDVYLAGNFDAASPADELLCLKPEAGNSDCVKLLGLGGGLQWWTLWQNFCDGTFGGTWNLGPTDKFVVGNFDGLPGDELLILSDTTYAKMYTYNGSGWTQLWGNNGNGMIFNGVLMNAIDQYVAGDFNPSNGPGIEELVLITEAFGGFSASGSWNGDFSGNLAWSGPGAGILHHVWAVDENDVYEVGNLVPGGGDELMAVSPGSATAHLLSHNGANFQIESIGAPWNLAYPTVYVSGDFEGADGEAELLYLKPGGHYAKMFKYEP